MKPLDWVVIKKSSQAGVVDAIEGEAVTVRLPRTDGWPFPSYVTCLRKEVKKAPKQVPVYQPAPF
jgi:hypothetical protein